MTRNDIIEGAYLMGFEPSEDNITAERLWAEVQEFFLLSLTK